MRKLSGQWGGAIKMPFLRMSTIFLLLSAAFVLIMPENANAQFWVSAGFKPGADAQHVIAYCSTSDVDPVSGQFSPVANDYEIESVACEVTTSSGQIVAHDPLYCALPSDGMWGASAVPDETPATAACTFNIEVQPGIIYIINSWHYIIFNEALLRQQRNPPAQRVLAGHARADNRRRGLFKLAMASLCPVEKLATVLRVSCPKEGFARRPLGLLIRADHGGSTIHIEAGVTDPLALPVPPIL